MLEEERFNKILGMLNKKGSITNRELVATLGASESTIRRDITFLASGGKLIKVHGGAIAAGSEMSSKDFEVNTRRMINADKKQSITKYAASLIADGDLVYIDAGTTTELLVKNLPKGIDACFVTNAVSHAILLEKKGYRAYIPGGRLKPVTEAIIGSEAIRSLRMYNFSKGFFGANGISHDKGITTPDLSESLIKEFALSQCKKRYILADSSKFDSISSVTFSRLEDVTIITDDLPAKYKKYNIIKV